MESETVLIPSLHLGSNMNNTKNIKVAVLSPEFYNYGAMLIAGILKDAGYNVTLKKGFNGDINADIVFLSLHSTIHLLKYREAIQNIRGFKVVGGPVSKAPELVLKYLPVDAVVIGEAENTVLKVVETLSLNGSTESIHEKLQRVNGLAFLKGDRVVKTGPAEKPSMERPLPFIPAEISHENIRGANVYIETHRGCPGSCGFCQVPCFFGRDVRSRSIEDILTEVKAFLKRGAKRIAVSGGTGSLYGSRKFRNVDEESFIHLLKGISELTGPRNLTIPDIRVDMISDDVLEAVKLYTNGWIYFGIESGSDRMLRHMKKGITVDRVIEAVESARKQGIKIAGSFIVGYPGEGEEDFNATMELADELMLDDYFVSIAEPIPGTLLGKEVLETGEEDDLLIQKDPEYSVKGLSVAEARAFNLMLESYVSRSVPIPMSGKLFNALLDEVKSQGKHIKTVTQMMKCLKNDTKNS
jgi:B12-binding domain/radical SAM domain protein